MDEWASFYGPNAGYALELYERFQRDPDTVDPATRAFFERLDPPPDGQSNGNGAGAVATLTRQAPAPPAPPAAPGTNGGGNGSGSHGAPAAIVAPSATAVLPAPGGSNGAGLAPPASEQDGAAGWYIVGDEVAKVVGAARLARSIREYGHLAADIDPLGAPRPGDPMLDPATHGITDADLARLPASIAWREAGPEAGTCLDAIGRLREIYSGPLGYDFDHVQDFAERDWLRKVVEEDTFRPPLAPEERRALLQRLTEVEGFERFLHSTFQGQKRFSIEGCDALVPMLDELIHDTAAVGTREVLVGMAHRGRLNVLAHVLGKPYAKIFSEFHHAPNKDLVPSEGSTGINQGYSGDVKYHLGARRMVREDNLVQVQLTLAHNPSHLEFINPVIEGFARAAQEDRGARGAPRQDVSCALAVAIHGDAAFPGEGVVAETLNLSRLPGYQTGGTVHLIANNQIGFTTGSDDARSTLYASDLAKGFEIPIIHVNADEPEACLAAIRIAHAYRERFRKDFLVDLVGYRRWGHNEGDEPAFTQPRLYAAIGEHPTVRARYAERLAADGLVGADEAEAMAREVRERLAAAHEQATGEHVAEEVPPLEPSPPVSSVETAVPADRLRELNEALLARPEGFVPNPRLERQLVRRREAFDKPGGIDWALAESLAFATILADGTPIRLTGQDAERGTFSHRHLVLHGVDGSASDEYVPLKALPQARASFAVHNSPLSESAPLGFEYGYSVHAPEALVLWEAQFGDFANAGQVLIDQFIVAARLKWRQHPSLVLLLPHGYEGQGPEHSSGRLERYLQLAAEDNLRIANCTTAAQYFHLLRAQAALLGRAPRPLVVMTPKSLLRHPHAASSLDELAAGGFAPVLDDSTAGPEGAPRREAVERLVLCSGKVAIDLATSTRPAPAPEGTPWVAVARVEQLYPFPDEALAALMAGYPNLREVVWLQEEPRNMGAWGYIAPRLGAFLPAGLALRYIGRPERASTAEGSADAHAAMQARIIEAAFGGERRAKIETRGGQDVG